MFRSVCSFKVVDELVEGENRNVFRFTKEDSSSGAKRNINLISVEVLRPQAGSYDKRCWTRVFPPAGRCKTSQGEVSRGYGTSNYSARPLADVSLARDA